MASIDINCKEHSIAAITVYPSGARVERDIKLEQPKGSTSNQVTVTLTDLPEYVHDNTFRVEVTPGVHILDVTFERVNVRSETISSSEMAKLESELEQAKEVYQRLIHYRETLDAVSAQSIIGAKTGLTKDNVDALASLLEFKERRGNELDKQIHDAKERGVCIQERYDKATQGGKSSYMGQGKCVVQISEGVVEFHLHVSYFHSHARWSPLYDVRAFPPARVAITYAALVTQFSGEEWREVDLKLSTASPSTSINPPELSEWEISILEPKPTFGTQPSVGVASFGMINADSLSIGAGAPRVSSSFFGQASAAPLPPPQAQVKATGASAVFEIPYKATIASDNQGHRVTIADLEFKAEFSHCLYPFQTPAVFLRAEIFNSSDYTLIQGPSSIYLENTFVAKSKIDLVHPEEKVTFSLGEDREVRAEVSALKTLKKKSSKGGSMFAQKNEESQTYRRSISILNGKRNKVDVEVYVQTPVSKNEELKVTLTSPNERQFASGEAAWHEEHRGVFMMRNAILASSKVSQDVEWTIKWPEKMLLIGI